MKILDIIAAIVFTIGILLIAGTGVDLTYTRAGAGMMVCAIGALLMAFGVVMRRAGGINGPWITAIVLGAAYFIWRALSGGPLGLAVEDVTIVLILTGAYLACAGGQLAGARILIGGIGIACLANAVVVAIQLSGQSQWFVWREPFGSKAIATGFFGHYNYFAAFLNGSLFLFLTLAFSVKSSLYRGICVVIVLSSIACLVASGSRGGWVSFVVGFGVWVVLGLIYLKSRRHSYFGLAAVVSLILLVALVVSSLSVVQEFTNRRAGIAEQEERVEDAEIGDGGRVYFQQLAFEIFQDSPVIGNGPKSFSYLALQHWDIEEHSIWNANPVFAHNEFLQGLADYGMVGFLIVLGVLLALCVTVIISIVSNDGGIALAPLKIGALCGLAAMVAQCNFSFVVHVPACALMIGLLAGIASQSQVKRQVTKGGMRAAFMASSLLLVSAGLAFLGWRYTQAYQLNEKAKATLAARGEDEEIFDILDLMKESSRMGYDYHLSEKSGRISLKYSARSDEAGDQEIATRYAHIAMDHFRQAIELNPHSSVSLVMIPHVHDALGNFKEAELGYVRAMEVLWVRETYLKPHLYAAKSQYRQGLLAEEKRKSVDAIGHYQLALDRLNRRTEILNHWRELPEDKILRLEIEARIAYLEGELLFQEGDRVWKKVRPRNPELAYGLMLAAAGKYQASQKVMEPINARWKIQWTQLQENLKLFEAVRTKPATLTEKQILRIINPEAGLAPGPATR